MYYLEYIIGVILCGFYNLQYRYQFGKYKSTRIDENTLYIHIPKTGGSALVNTLGIDVAGHFTIKQRERIAGKADKIVVTFRDPISRLISIWKYSKTPLLTTINSPLKTLGRYNSLDKFVESGIFSAFNKYHYFFRTQKAYMEGYEPSRHELVVLNQETLAEDVKQKLNREIAVVNKSPDLDIHLSQKNRKYLKKLYAVDYKFIDEVSAS